MKAYSITYDLSAPNRDYSGLYEEIKELGSWWHYLESTWIVVTDKTAKEIWKDLASSIDKDDRLLIIELRNNMHGWMPTKAWDWINDNVPS